SSPPKGPTAAGPWPSSTPSWADVSADCPWWCEGCGSRAGPSLAMGTGSRLAEGGIRPTRCLYNQLAPNFHKLRTTLHTVGFFPGTVISPVKGFPRGRPTMSSRAGSVAGVLCAVMLLVAPGAGQATVFPPPQIDYQGVLRGPAGEPLTGTYDMTFRFFDAETGGNEILIDPHVAATAKEVIVSGGLFSVALGGGLGVVDGSGPGSYTSLIPVFRDYPSVWLEVTIGTETLAPRNRVLAAGYALNAANAGAADVATSATTAVSASTAANATNLNGQPASFYLDTGSTRQFKSGAARFTSGDASGHVLEAYMQPGSLGAMLAEGTNAYCELGDDTVGAVCGGTS